MANIKQRRKVQKKPDPIDDAPWHKGDPSRKYGLNTPIPEPLMMQLDYLIENKAILSKASFIREVVEKAAQEEIGKLRRVREAIRRMEAEEQ